MRVLLSTGPEFIIFSWYSKDHMYRACLECGRPGTKADVMLNRLLVPKPCRQQGIATALMEEFCGYVDHNRLSAELGINPYGDMSYEQLAAFYGKYGFKEVEDPEYTGLFIREPQ